MVVEPLQGCDLQRFLGARGPLPIPEAVDYVVQACVVVAQAHAAGVVHRNLHPSSLLLTRRADGAPLVKVLDFGESGDLVGSSAVAGSPAYMSPERVRGLPDADALMDVWSLGAILHFLLVGEPPFSGASFAELLSVITGGAPQPLTSMRKDVPPEVEAIVCRCLEKDRTVRIPNVLELARMLAPWTSKSADVEPTPSTRRFHDPLAGEDTYVPPFRPARSKLTLYAALAGAALLPLGVWELLSHRPQSPPPSTWLTSATTAEPIVALPIVPSTAETTPPPIAPLLPPVAPAPAAAPAENVQTPPEPSLHARLLAKGVAPPIQRPTTDMRARPRIYASAPSAPDLRALFDERL
jgi:serine/threonine protein kinase